MVFHLHRLVQFHFDISYGCTKHFRYENIDLAFGNGKIGCECKRLVDLRRNNTVGSLKSVVNSTKRLS